MATVRGWSLQGNISAALDYILDLKNEQEKTDNGRYVHSSFDEVSPYLAGYSWKQNQLIKQNESVGYHLQLSFPRDEGTPEQCLEVAKEWVDTISNGKAKYVIAVHTNTKNIHAHIICDWYLNDGKRWNIFWKRDIKKFKVASDRICKRHGLSVLEQTQERGQHYFEWMQEHKNNDSDRNALKKILDTAINRVSSYEDLKKYLDALGFVVMDKTTEKEKNKNVFSFTADIKLIKDEPDGSYFIRIPHQKNWIKVDEEYVKWLKPNKTARITLPLDKKLNLFDGLQNYLDTVTADKLRENFEGGKSTERQGLRIVLPNRQKPIRTQFLYNEDGESYSIENIKKRIRENRAYYTDAEVLNRINNKDDFQSVLEGRRNLYEKANVSVGLDSKTVFRSARQENYYRWRATQIQKRMDTLSYNALLEKDRENLDLLKGRRSELQTELNDIVRSLNELDQEITVLMQQRMENTITISDDELESSILESKEPLLKRKEELMEMIRLYSQRINKVEPRKNQKEMSYMHERTR